MTLNKNTIAYKVGGEEDEGKGFQVSLESIKACMETSQASICMSNYIGHHSFRSFLSGLLLAFLLDLFL